MQAYLSKLSNTHKVVWTKILEINNISLKVCWSPRSKISDGEAGARGPGPGWLRARGEWGEWPICSNSWQQPPSGHRQRPGDGTLILNHQGVRRKANSDAVVGDQERLRVSVAKVRTNVLFELKLKINVFQCLRIGIKG